MRVFLGFALFLLLSISAKAEEILITEDVQPEADTVLEEINTPDSQTVVPVVYTVEKEILPLPSCDDKTLMAKTKEYITAYFAKSDNVGTLFRRRRHFLINNMEDFTLENIANYKTAATSPISDEIVDLQINHNILEENMRLCKKKAADKLYSDIYLLVYPIETGYRVHVLNLDKRSNAVKNIFEYRSELDFSDKTP